jgi:hypothetical protein
MGHRANAAILVVFVVSASACSSGGAGGTNPTTNPDHYDPDASSVTGPPIAHDDFCRSYTLAVCDAKKRCCANGADGGSTFDEAACISSERNACDAATKTEESKKATYDEAAGGDCVARAQAASCDARRPGLADACPDVFVGSAQVGDLCAAAKCAPGLSCPEYPAAGCEGCPGPPPSKCVSIVAEGGACGSLDTPCARGLVCDAGKCRALSTSGGPCASADQCADGLYCDTAKTKTCAPKLGIGERCSDLGWCTSGECLNGVCTPAASAPICR